MDDELIDLNTIRKEEIAEALKSLRRVVKEMEQLQKHNFGGLYDEDGYGPSPSGHIPAKYRLLNLGHEIALAGADVLRYAADLNEEEEESR